MKKTLLLFSALWLALSGFGQRTLDLGLWGGTSNYFGDLEGVTHFQSFNPVGGLFVRYNFNSRVSLRATGLFGSASAEKGLLFGSTPPFPFKPKPFQDFSVQGEVNYLKYIFGEKKTPFSSYISAGFSMLHMNKTDSINPITKIKGLTPALAFGFGIKANVGKKIAIGLEYQMRKLFDDNLDNVNDPFRNTNGKGQLQTYNDTWHNNDWLTFLGLHLTYVINMDRKPCPAYDKKQ